jgi:transposase
MPNDLPPREAVSQQTHRWLKAGVFEAIVHDLRMLLRLADGRTAHPSAPIPESRTRQSRPESGRRAGDDGATRERGSQAPPAVDTLGHRLPLPGTPAHAQDRAYSDPTK